MIITVRQAERPNDANQLHQELIAAGVSPQLVESDATETRVHVAPSQEAAARSVVAAHVKQPRPAPPNLKALADSFRAAVNNATTVAQIKAALNKELMVLLREVAQGHRGETGG